MSNSNSNFEFTSWDLGREICVEVHENKKLNLVVCNRLHPAELNDYSHIFADYSRIQFQLYDYANKKSAIYNFKVEEFLYLYKNIERFKIARMLGANVPFEFADKRPNKKNGWNNFTLSYQDGRNYPWKLEISNNSEADGNLYYQFYMDDSHFEQMLIAINNVIETFKITFGGPLLTTGYEWTKYFLSQYQSNNTGNNSQQ